MLNRWHCHDSRCREERDRRTSRRVPGLTTDGAKDLIDEKVRDNECDLTGRDASQQLYGVLAARL